VTATTVLITCTTTEHPYPIHKMTIVFIKLTMVATTEESLTPIKTYIESNVSQECCSEYCNTYTSLLTEDDINVGEWNYDFNIYVETDFNYNDCLAGLKSQLDSLDKTNVNSIELIKVLECHHDSAQSNTPCVPEYEYVWRS